MSIGWQEARIVHIHDWAEGLRTLRLDLSLPPFDAGRFVNLALDLDGERLTRSYSMASAPGQPPEFFINRIEGGAFTPHLFQLQGGDSVWVNPMPAGYFTLERVKSANVLWLIATGTGLGPYVSMLRTPEPWDRFGRVVVVHGVRVPEHLAYRDELAERSAKNGGRLTWVPVVSRVPEAPDVLHGRIPALLADGQLEARVGSELTPESSQVLLCGNPGMIKETRALLKERGLARNRPRKPGHVTTEAYWGG